MNRIEAIAFAKTKKERALKNSELAKTLKQHPEERKKIEGEMREALDNTGERIFFLKEQIEIKLKLQEVSEMISLSYIADKYFNKTRQWLYQRINGNIVGGKRMEFTQEQLDTLNFALKDIGKKIGTMSI